MCPLQLEIYIDLLLYNNVVGEGRGYIFLNAGIELQNKRRQLEESATWLVFVENAAKSFPI